MYTEVTSVYVPVKTPDYPVWAILVSGIAHAILVGLLFYFYHTAPQAPMQTTLITPEQLSQLQGQIKANQQNAQAVSGDTSGAPAQPSTSTDTMSTLSRPAQPSTSTNQIETVKNELAAKQAQWEKEQALFAEKLDQEVEAERQSVVDDLNQRSDTEQRNLQDYKIAESNLDDVKNELRANAAAYNKNLNAKNDRQTDNSSQSLDLGRDGKSTGAGQSQTPSSGGNGASKRGGASGGSKNSYINAIYSKIYNNWDIPNGSKGKKLTVNIRISSSGNVLSMNFAGSGDAVFENSLRDAINRSNPLPMPEDSSFYQSFGGNISLNFKGDK